jgi:hypothetical protein
MKKIFLATAAAAALFAVPAMAQNVGSVGVNYANLDPETGADRDMWTVDGVVAMPAFGAWTVTLDGAIGNNDSAIGDRTSLSATAHLTTMVGSDLRVGGFIAADDVVMDHAVSVGAEVQKYFSTVTLSGAVSYTHYDLFNGESYNAGVEAAWYVRPNIRLAADISVNEIDMGLADDTIWAYGVTGEYEFASTPYSVTAGFNRADVLGMDVDTYSVGLRYNFGGGLQQRERAGANLKSFTGAAVMSLF